MVLRNCFSKSHHDVTFDQLIDGELKLQVITLLLHSVASLISFNIVLSLSLFWSRGQRCNPAIMSWRKQESSRRQTLSEMCWEGREESLCYTHSALTGGLHIYDTYRRTFHRQAQRLPPKDPTHLNPERVIVKNCSWVHLLYAICPGESRILRAERTLMQLSRHIHCICLMALTVRVKLPPFLRSNHCHPTTTEARPSVWERARVMILWDAPHILWTHLT